MGHPSLVRTAASKRAPGALVCKGSPTMGKQRLDVMLAERGLFPSRARAAASIMAGEVRIGRGGRRAAKPGELVDEHESLTVTAPARFASRGGLKLDHALLRCDLDVRGRRALDVGSSTGGFVDCLLQRGVSEVVAVDVGYGTLDYRLRTDPRVHVRERTNARALQRAELPYAPDLATIDVSFISLEKVLAPVLGCMAQRYDMLALVKPQFEVGRKRVGKGGVVRDASHRREALVAVGAAALALGAAVRGYRSSGLPGPKGNRETFIWLADARRAGSASADGPAGVAELDAMAREVEP